MHYELDWRRRNGCVALPPWAAPSHRRPPKEYRALASRGAV